MYNYTTNVLVTVSTSPTILDVGPVETHSFKLDFHACFKSNVSYAKSIQAFYLVSDILERGIHMIHR